MRLVDFYIDPILKLRELLPTLDGSDQDYVPVKKLFTELLVESQSNGIRLGNFDQETVEAAMFPIVAFIDECLMTSRWKKRLQWQKYSLQREFFKTANAGKEFYQRLNTLNRQGNDRSIREVYLLCLGLGFKGQYYSPHDKPKIEEVRVFNLDLLLPQDANRTFEKSLLFSEAYTQEQVAASKRKSRLNITPFIAISPLVIVGGFLLFYASQIGSELNQIMNLVK